MEQIDWTAVIVALVGSGGLLTAVLTARAHARKPGGGQGGEPAHPATGALLIPSTHEAKALSLAQSAMDQAGALSDRLLKTEARLNEVESELGKFRRSYMALYAWAQKIIYDWSELREKPDPPELPTDIHHP